MRVFGLIGNPLTHSFSKKYFTQKFEQENIAGCRYELYPLENIDQLPALLQQEPALEGINVTIPYKEQVLAYLDEQSPAVQQIKACNCIHIADGKLVGHNTDVLGFQRSLQQQLQPHHTQALILGTGGAAKAVAFALQQLQLSYQYVSRRPGDNTVVYEDLSPAFMQSHTLIINTTPLGTYPDTEQAPPIPYSLLTARHHLYDLVYNPAETLFLRKGKEQGAQVQNGADMLVIQAEESWKIWNS